MVKMKLLYVAVLLSVASAMNYPGGSSRGRNRTSGSFDYPRSASASVEDPRRASTSNPHRASSSNPHPAFSYFTEPHRASTSVGDPRHESASNFDCGSGSNPHPAFSYFTEPHRASASVEDPRRASASNPHRASGSYPQPAFRYFTDPHRASTSFEDPRRASAYFVEPNRASVSCDDLRNASAAFEDQSLIHDNHRAIKFTVENHPIKNNNFCGPTFQITGEFKSEGTKVPCPYWLHECENVCKNNKCAGDECRHYGKRGGRKIIMCHCINPPESQDKKKKNQFKKIFNFRGAYRRLHSRKN